MLPPIARAKGQHVEPSACESPTTHFVETSLAEFATAIPDLANQNLYAGASPLPGRGAFPSPRPIRSLKGRFERAARQTALESVSSSTG